MLGVCACAWLTIAPSSPAIARAEAIPDFQTWTQLQSTVGLDRIYEGLSINLESTVRRGSPAIVDRTDGTQYEAPLTYLFIRPSVGLDVTRQINLTLGYAWAPVFYDEQALRSTQQVNEHRVWEQFTFAHVVSLVGLASRTRLEQRMRTHGPGEGETEVRLRQRFRGAYTFKQDHPWQAVVTDELMFFLNTTNFSSEPGFSENRAFFGLGYRAKGVGLEAGYLNQYIGGHATWHRQNHVLSTSMTFSFDLPKEP